MKNDINVVKDILISYLESLDGEIAKKEIEKLKNNDTIALYLHVDIVSKAFNEAKKELEKMIMKEGKENEVIK